jgi:hypothetical protein
MGANPTHQPEWMEFQSGTCIGEPEKAEELLRNLEHSFTQASLAADFLLLKEEPGTATPELQLACLIKERIATIQEQVTELYQVLTQEDSRLLCC